MHILLKDRSGYLERILMDDKKTVVSKLTGLSYTWFMDNYPNFGEAEKDFVDIYTGLIANDIRLATGETVGLGYYFLMSKQQINTIDIQGSYLTTVWGSFIHVMNNLLANRLHLIDHSLLKSFCRFSEVFFELQQYISSTGYINATSKLASLTPLYAECGERIYIESLYYAYIDQIDGNKLTAYTTLLEIKAFQRDEQMKKYVADIFDDKFMKLIHHKNIDTIILVPNNARRAVSFNEYIYTSLVEMKLPNIHIYPYTSIIVNEFTERKPQKSLRGIYTRIDNATKLFDCSHITTGSNILLIDDAFGSGATMMMIAKKIKNNLPDCHITGLSCIGSMRNGFDVLSEV